MDITYTVNGGQNVAAGQYYRLLFTATVDGTAYTVSGDTLGASAASGQHTVTWNNPPAGIKPTSLALTAAFYPADVPSGDDYMIVDLATGAVTYEGLLATQDASNARYNTAVYKTDKMVFRKIPGGGTYLTGDNQNYSLKNSVATWKTDRDFYVAVFIVTQAQYEKLGMSNPSGNTTDKNGDIAAHRPVNRVSWLQIRGAAITPDIAITPAADGSFLERLTARTMSASGIGGFDLPTVIMSEIARRAGRTTAFSWGDDGSGETVTQYAVCNLESTNKVQEMLAVGSRLPNDWGLFDTAGNVWEWALDDTGRSDVSTAPDPWTPASENKANRCVVGSGGYSGHASSGEYRASRINVASADRWTDAGHYGFRVAWIRE